jgi:hypothetical protein
MVRLWWADSPGEWQRSCVPGPSTCSGSGGEPGRQDGSLRLINAR